MSRKKLLSIIIIVVFGSLSVWNLALAYPIAGEYWDLGSFLLAGWSFDQGINPYSLEGKEVWSEVHKGTLTGPNVNSPVSLFLFIPLSRLEPTHLPVIWFFLQLALLFTIVFVSTRSLIPSFPRYAYHAVFLFALSLAGQWYALELLQLYLFLAGLVFLTIFFHEHQKEVMAGTCLGLIVSLKPQFLFLLAFLYLAKERTLVKWATITFTGLHVISALTFGPEIYFAWFAATKAKAFSLAGSFSLQTSIVSPLSYFLPFSYLNLVGGLLLCGYIYLLAPKLEKASLSEKIGFGCMGPLLLLPFAWIGYLVLIIYHLVEKIPNRSVCAALLPFTVPPYVIYHFADGPLEGVFLWYYPVSFLLLTMILIRSSLRQAE